MLSFDDLPCADVALWLPSERWLAAEPRRPIMGLFMIMSRSVEPAPAFGLSCGAPRLPASQSFSADAVRRLPDAIDVDDWFAPVGSCAPNDGGSRPLNDGVRLGGREPLRRTASRLSASAASSTPSAWRGGLRPSRFASLWPERGDSGFGGVLESRSRSRSCAADAPPPGSMRRRILRPLLSFTSFLSGSVPCTLGAADAGAGAGAGAGAAGAGAGTAAGVSAASVRGGDPFGPSPCGAACGTLGISRSGNKDVPLARESDEAAGASDASDDAWVVGVAILGVPKEGWANQNGCVNKQTQKWPTLRASSGGS